MFLFGLWFLTSVTRAATLCDVVQAVSDSLRLAGEDKGFSGVQARHWLTL